MFKSSIAAVALLTVAALSPVGAQSAVSRSASSSTSLTVPVAGITKPYEERKLQFNQPGVVTQVNVKVGETIKAEQVLAQQDTSVEVAMRRPLEIEANSKVQETYARADQGVKEQEYKRKQDLFKTQNASESEVEEARLAVERAKASVQIAIEERDKANAKIAEIDARIALKTLKSPISGFVQQIDTGAGEVGGIDQQKPSMVVVQNDPLKVDVNIPIREANKLKVGQTIQIRYTDEDKAQWQPAQILAMLPVAERGSQTRGVVLEVPNPNNKPAGVLVDVSLAANPPAPPAANAAGQR